MFLNNELVGKWTLGRIRSVSETITQWSASIESEQYTLVLKFDDILNARPTQIVLITADPKFPSNGRFFSVNSEDDFFQGWRYEEDRLSTEDATYIDAVLTVCLTDTPLQFSFSDKRKPVEVTFQTYELSRVLEKVRSDQLEQRKSK